MVTKIIVGNRAPRYKLKDRKETFLRSEIQKVAKVTKTDPRKKKLKIADLRKKKRDELTPKPVRKSKYLRKDVYIHYANEDEISKEPATVLDIYKDYFIVLHPTFMTICTESEIKRVTGKTYTKAEVDGWIKENADAFQNRKDDIDDEYDQIEKEIDSYIANLPKE